VCGCVGSKGDGESQDDEDKSDKESDADIANDDDDVTFPASCADTADTTVASNDCSVTNSSSVNGIQRTDGDS